MVEKKGQRGHRNWSAIKAGYQKGESCSALALHYGVHVSSLYRRARKEAWLREKAITNTLQKKPDPVQTQFQTMDDPVRHVRILLARQIMALDDLGVPEVADPEKTTRLLIHITRALHLLDSLERTRKESLMMDKDDRKKTEHSKPTLKSLRARLERRLNSLAAKASETKIPQKSKP